MNIKYWLLLLFFLPHVSLALECTGQIVEVSSNASQCIGHFAYKTSGNPTYWLCSDSDLNDSLILNSYAAQRSVIVMLPGSGSCQVNFNANYLTPDSLKILPAGQ